MYNKKLETQLPGIGTRWSGAGKRAFPKNICNKIAAAIHPIPFS